MSKFENYNSKDVAMMYGRGRYLGGADVMAGLLHIYCVTGWICVEFM